MNKKHGIALLSLMDPKRNSIILDNKHYLSDLVNIHIIPPCFHKESVKKKVEKSDAVIILIGTDKYNQDVIEFIKNSLQTYKDKIHIVVSVSHPYSYEINGILDLADRNLIFEDYSEENLNNLVLDSHQFVTRLSKYDLKVHVASVIIVNQFILLMRGVL